MPSLLNRARRRLLRRLRDRQAARDEAHVRAEPPLWTALTEYRAHSGSTGCSYSDYWALYEWVRRHRPREILECGTGVSTIALAVALRDNERATGLRGRVTSMEEGDDWYAMARASLPADLAPYVDLRQSPRAEFCHALFRGTCYAEVPARPYEFVFVDGPGTRAPSDGTRCFNADFLREVLRAERPIAAQVDRRLSTVAVLQALFGADRVRYDVRREQGLVSPVTRADLRVLRTSSSPALAARCRLWGATHLALALDPPADADAPP